MTDDFKVWQSRNFKVWQSRIEWDKYPKLAGIFQELPLANVYWSELEALLMEFAVSMNAQWEGLE
jgi:hypothetical protein